MKENSQGIELFTELIKVDEFILVFLQNSVDRGKNGVLEQERSEF